MNVNFTVFALTFFFTPHFVELYAKSPFDTVAPILLWTDVTTGTQQIHGLLKIYQDWITEEIPDWVNCYERIVGGAIRILRGREDVLDKSPLTND